MADNANMSANDHAGNQIPFDVDAALLRELGERLVGRADIAVAELVKNAYDADASLVRIQIDKDCIVVEDDGHGMSEGEFRSFWMRIGSPHKAAQRISRSLRRPLTGFKGCRATRGSIPWIEC